MKCLNDEQLNMLSQKNPDKDLIFRILEHAQNCSACRDKLTACSEQIGSLRILAESILDIEDCPEYETLSKYLDGDMDQAYTRKITAHVNGCTLCSRDIERMKSLRAQAQMRGAVVVTPEQFKVHSSSSPIYKWVFGTSLAAIGFVTVFAVMPMLKMQNVKAPVTAMVPETTKTSEAPAIKAPNTAVKTTNKTRTLTASGKKAVKTNIIKTNEPSEKPVIAYKPDTVLKDGGLSIIRKNGKLVVESKGRGGSIEKLIASYVGEKIRSGRVTPSEKPVQMAMINTAVRGQGNNKPSAIAPKLIGPDNKVVLSSQPLLEWHAVDLAQDYKVTVTDSNGRVVYENIIDNTHVKINTPLMRGKAYAWRVASRFSDESEWEVSSAAVFKVVSEDGVKLLDNVRREMGNSKLAMGAAYESLQLHDEAQREYRSLAPRVKGTALQKSLSGK